MSSICFFFYIYWNYTINWGSLDGVGNLDGVPTTDLDGEGIYSEARILINGNPNDHLKATQLLGS